MLSSFLRPLVKQVHCLSVMSVGSCFLRVQQDCINRLFELHSRPILPTQFCAGYRHLSFWRTQSRSVRHVQSWANAWSVGPVAVSRTQQVPAGNVKEDTMKVVWFLCPGPCSQQISQSRCSTSLPWVSSCLLYTSPSPRDATLSRMPSSA